MMYSLTIYLSKYDREVIDTSGVVDVQNKAIKWPE